MWEEVLKYLIELLIRILDSYGENSIVMLSPSTFLPSVYNFVSSIASNVCMPIAVSLLALFGGLELMKLMERGTESFHGLNAVQVPAMVIFKICTYTYILGITPDLLKLLYDITANLSSGISNQAIEFAFLIEYNSLIAEAGYNITTGLTAVILLVVAIILVFIIKILVYVLIYGRMVELYILIAISPIPLATLPNQEWRNTGINFIKYFFAVSFQGVLIILVNRIITAIIANGASETAFNNPFAIIWYVFALLAQLCLYAMCLFFTGRWAKSICNAT